jgi:hypothetical protein
LPAEEKPTNITVTVTEVSERIQLLVKDEIELAKLEVMTKVKSLVTGSAFFAAAAGLALFGVLFFPVTLAWVIDAIFVTGAGDIWVGFLAVMLIFFAGALMFVFLGIRKMKVGSPVPKQAIAEAQKIKETVTAKPEARA